MSSPESALLPRDTDFGYEVIDKPDKGQEGDNEDASSVSVADHYRGAPPVKVKKKKNPGRGSGVCQHERSGAEKGRIAKTATYVFARSRGVLAPCVRTQYSRFRHHRDFNLPSDHAFVVHLSS